ncbi:MAG: hypothetical protein ACR2M5_02515 [Nakamurella sp.]
MPGLEERLAMLSPHLHDGVALSVAARRELHCGRPAGGWRPTGPVGQLV